MEGFLNVKGKKRAYHFLKKYTRHRTVSHTSKKYINDYSGAHTNFVESWHSLIRWQFSKYRMVSEEYLENYLAECVWKVGLNKKEDDLLRLCVA